MLSKISLIFILAITSIYSQSDLRILSSDANSIVIEYSLSGFDTTHLSIDNNEFIKLSIPNSFIADPYNWGMPQIFHRSFNLGVPDEFGNTIQLMNFTYEDIQGLLAPNPQIFRESGLTELSYKLAQGYFDYSDEGNLVVFGDYGIARGLKVQQILIRPVSFVPYEKKIRIYKSITFKVNYSSNKKFSKTPVDNFSDGAVINFNIARYWTDESSKKLYKVTNAPSVLASGKWIKFEAPEEGIYKISRSMLPNFGIDPATVDPRTIKIYNNGGMTLPENPNTPRPLDLIEHAITIIGEEDGRFDEGDYILFYGRGVNFWYYDSTSGKVRRNKNVCSDKNYYWITSGGEAGKRIQTLSGLSQNPDFIQQISDGYAYWEEDKINIGKSGKLFLGDDFSQSVVSRTYSTKLDSRLNQFPVNYSVSFVNASSADYNVQFTESNLPVHSQTAVGYRTELYSAGKNTVFNFKYDGQLVDNRSVLKISITPTAVTSTGYIDYIEMFYKKSLDAVNDNLCFFSEDTSGVVEYYLRSFSSTNIRVFDVTDYSNVKSINNFSMLSGGECKFRLNSQIGKVKKYYAVGSDQFKTPINPVEVGNSNLRGIELGSKFIIITHKSFIDAAQKLKNLRENQSIVKISTTVVDVEQIFNEFGGGIPDFSAIRDFIRHAYFNWQIKPEYVLLLGGGNYDYKNVEGFDKNFIPTFQTDQSLDLITSYTTDDYFVRVDGPDKFIDLAAGRITCNSLSEADNVINKIIEYEQNSDKKAWRNLITLIADDGYRTSGFEGNLHTAPSEKLANQVIPESYNLKKIYLAVYPDVITSSGRRKPSVNEAILNAIEDGTIILNYIGHGSPDVWAHEVVFDKGSMVPRMKNDRYFFLTAATCDFGYYDIPNFNSATQEMLALKDGGLIGAFTSARLVYAFENTQLMESYFQFLLSHPRDTLNLSLPIGKITYFTKLQQPDVNDQKYHLFGDPTLRLNIPQYNSSIDSVNNQSLDVAIQIKALSTASVKGRILDENGNTWESYNGEGVLTVYDSQRKLLIEQFSRPNNPYYINLQGGTIFNGRVSIINGRFSTSFVVPKDISYENKNGKILLYFFNPSTDGVGYTSKIIVGGTDTLTQNDGKGPEIEIYFDKSDNVGGYLVNPNSSLIVELSDETGLNTTGTGVGHKLEGILNDEENNPIDFTDYFTGDLDAGGKSGEINYRFSNLDIGDYKIKVKAWDVFNNFSDEETFFTVVDGNKLTLRDVYNYPNPFSSGTTFTLQHNLNEPAEIKIKIYTIAGRLIKEIDAYGINDRFVKIDWDGRDADGNIIGNGVYLYKVILKSGSGNTSESVIGKLAVIR
ncbi:MAG: type IX secretion system sortase PorU [Ignavibacteriaceae bacterium]|nr:type IX secretion system sortase PorU [Ignavibacteriaceae bacterium]